MYVMAGVCSTSARKRASASDSSCCASFSAVTSNITPCQKRGAPSSPTTSRASSRNQTVRPSRATDRYSTLKGSPEASVRVFSARTRSRSSSCIVSYQSSGCSIHSADVTPSTSSMRGLMYIAMISLPTTGSEYTTTGSCSTSERYRASVSAACDSAARWRVTSTMMPCQNKGVPAGSRTRTASSWNQTSRPSRCSIR